MLVVIQYKVILNSSRNVFNMFAIFISMCTTGFDPQPRHTKSRKKMVQVAPLLTLGIGR